MVSFRNFVVSALALAGPIAAELSPSQIVDSLRSLTTKAQAIQGPAQSINTVNGPLIVIGQGPFPQIINQYVDIVSTSTTFISQSGGSRPVESAADQTAIYNAYREFARVNQATLNILIGKAGLFNTVPFIGQPMSAVLRQVENVYDTIAFMLIDANAAKATDLQSQANSLGMTLDTAIKSYEGFQTKKRSLRFAARNAAIKA